MAHSSAAEQVKRRVAWPIDPVRAYHKSPAGEHVFIVLHHGIRGSAPAHQAGICNYMRNKEEYLAELSFHLGMAHCEGAPEGMEKTEQPLEEQAPPAPSSRISIKKAVEVIDSFNDYKRWLVTEIGFGGMLKLPAIQKLNLKFSAWVMSKVSVRRRAIVLSESKIIKFFAEDVHKVFGIPCGHRSVKGRDGFIKPEAISFIKGTLGMDKTGVHSLRAAEEFLMREIAESSSKLEKDCFQIAFVIFVMGHVLAPRTKHDYGTIDYWGALANTENISQFNWSLMPILFITMCVQVFFLDNVDLGIFNKKHNVLPRIMDTMMTPAGPKIPGVRLDMSACKGDMSRTRVASEVLPDQQQAKRPRHDDDLLGTLKAGILQFARHTMQEISERFIDLPNDGSTTVFGERTAGLPGRKYVHRPGFQTDPWIRGVVPCPPQPYVSQLLEEFFATAPPEVLSRNFLVHENPRFIRITGLALKQQLVGDVLIDHELMSVIIRRYCQADQEANKHSPYLTWRHPLEPEFSSLVLSEQDYLHTMSIQKALGAMVLQYDITSAQLFFTPVPRPEGWIVIFWDMVARVIYVIDPMYSKNSQPLITEPRDEIIAWKLHDALFNCFAEYYAGWPVKKDAWKLKFLALADSIFNRNESGACAVHITRHFDGKKLKIPLTKHTISKTKRETLHECMKLQGNFSSHVRDVLWRLLAPADSMFESE
ncbi:hypothetical protein VPH35_097373 [Triticum aestivum]